MQPWLEQSRFSRVYAYELLSDSHQSAVMQTKGAAMTMVAFIITAPSVVDVLFHGINVLTRLIPCFQNDVAFLAGLRKQRDTMRYVYERINDPIPTDAQYRLVYPFLSWFNKNKSSSYIALSERDPLFLLFLLEFFSVVLVLVVALPATDTPFLACCRARAVLDLIQRLEAGQGVICPGCSSVHDYRDIVDFPLNAMRLYRQGRTTATQAGQVQSRVF
jgi:hypothetical protein